MALWWNWQTRTTQNRMLSRASRFDPEQSHHFFANWKSDHQTSMMGRQHFVITRSTRKLDELDITACFGYFIEMKFGLLLVTCLIALSCHLAYASLGGDSTTVQKDAAKIKSKATVTLHPSYSMYEMSQKWGRVHEFAAASGNVFAVAWRGNKHPNLDQLMGDHLKDFQSALGKARQNRGHNGVVMVEVGNIHLEMGGHFQSVYGKIWLKDQLPSKMDLHEIQ